MKYTLCVLLVASAALILAFICTGSLYFLLKVKENAQNIEEADIEVRLIGAKNNFEHELQSLVRETLMTHSHLVRNKTEMFRQDEFMKTASVQRRDYGFAQNLLTYEVHIVRTVADLDEARRKAALCGYTNEIQWGFTGIPATNLILTNGTMLDPEFFSILVTCGWPSVNDIVQNVLVLSESDQITNMRYTGNTGTITLDNFITFLNDPSLIISSPSNVTEDGVVRSMTSTFLQFNGEASRTTYPGIAWTITTASNILVHKQAMNFADTGTRRVFSINTCAQEQAPPFLPFTFDRGVFALCKNLQMEIFLRTDATRQTVDTLLELVSTIIVDIVLLCLMTGLILVLRKVQVFKSKELMLCMQKDVSKSSLFFIMHQTGNPLALISHIIKELIKTEVHAPNHSKHSKEEIQEKHNNTLQKLKAIETAVSHCQQVMQDFQLFDTNEVPVPRIKMQPTILLTLLRDTFLHIMCLLQKQFSTRLTLSNEVQKTFYCDGMHMRQIVFAALQNAVTHSTKEHNSVHFVASGFTQPAPTLAAPQRTWFLIRVINKGRIIGDVIRDTILKRISERVGKGSEYIKIQDELDKTMDVPQDLIDFSDSNVHTSSRKNLELNMQGKAMYSNGILQQQRGMGMYIIFMTVNAMRGFFQISQIGNEVHFLCAIPVTLVDSKENMITPSDDVQLHISPSIHEETLA